jgi:hypothetical protein
MSLGGTYDVVTKTPMGDQSGTMVVVPGDDGSTFSGYMTSAMGRTDVEDGKINGNRMTWKTKMVVPMPMTLECDATVEGGVLSGKVKAGAFGSMPLSGQFKGA